MDRLADSLTQLGVSRCDRREIYRYRQFYLTYPQIVEAVTPQLLWLVGREILVGTHAPSGAPVPAKVEAAPQFRIDGKTLISRLSFTHIVEILNLEDATKRTFYEVEWEPQCARRCGVSRKKAALPDWLSSTSVEAR